MGLILQPTGRSGVTLTNLMSMNGVYTKKWTFEHDERLQQPAVVSHNTSQGAYEETAIMSSILNLHQKAYQRKNTLGSGIPCILHGSAIYTR